MTSKNRILVIGAHPDDETLGVGGTIYNATKSGHIVDILLLSTGVGSREVDREESAMRLAAAKRALGLLGCHDICVGDFPDNSFDSVGLLTLARFIESKINEIRPNIVFTNFHSDLNVDHRLTCEASLIATRPKPDSSVNELYFYEVLSSTGWQFGAKQFRPMYFTDITDSMAQKEAALREYSAEMDESPSARSHEAVKALAKFRGNFIGFEYAEAFEIGFIRKKVDDFG
jgi:LmbE family N-acetylglucosaminyl deacetylase